MKYMRRTAGYTWTDHKTNIQIAKELQITPILDKLQEYKRNWIHHVNRMPRNRLPTVMKQYSPTGRRNHGRPLKRLLDAWDRNGSTSCPNPWQIDDDDDTCLLILFTEGAKYWWENVCDITITLIGCWYNTVSRQLLMSFETRYICCMLSFGWFPGVWNLYADVSEHSVPSS